MRRHESLLPIALLILTACQNLPASNRSEDVSTSSIRDGVSVSEQLKAGEEIHWTNKLGAPVSIIFSEPVSDTLSCGKDFNRFSKNRTEATLDPDETVGLCFREPGTIRYFMKRQPKPAEGLDAARSQNEALNSRISDLERQLADRNREIAALRSDTGEQTKLSMTKLKQAERGLIRALRPQIDKKNITVDLNNERLLINLASGYLFGSGEDQLKPAGADALKQVGSILKDFPEYKVHVEGHTDNRPILGALKKQFPSNHELSEARAANAVEALASSGLSGAHAMGAADTKPVMPNTTAAGRAKNRRVEVSVTK